MQGFAYGPEDFDARLSEAIDRARMLLRNIYPGGMAASRPGPGSTGFPRGPFGGPFAAPGRGPGSHEEGFGPAPHGPHEHGPHEHGPHEHGPHEHGPHEHGPGRPGPGPHGPGPHASHEPHFGAGWDEEGPGRGEAGSWGGPWGRGFAGKDWAAFFGGPRSGWRPGGGGRRGPGGPGGPGGPRRPKASRGDVRATILALLSEGPRTGYQIMSDIEERSRGAWRPSPGAVYPALQLLADEGLIVGEEAGGRRTFSLTDAGREYVENNPEMARGAWESMADSDSGFCAGDIPRLFTEAARLGAAIAQTAHAGTPDQIRAAERLLKETRRTLYEFLADEDTDEEPGGQDD